MSAVANPAKRSIWNAVLSPTEIARILRGASEESPIYPVVLATWMDGPDVDKDPYLIGKICASTYCRSIEGAPAALDLLLRCAGPSRSRGALIDWIANVPFTRDLAAIITRYGIEGDDPSGILRAAAVLMLRLKASDEKGDYAIVREACDALLRAAGGLQGGHRYQAYLLSCMIDALPNAEDLVRIASLNEHAARTSAVRDMISKLDLGPEFTARVLEADRPEFDLAYVANLHYPVDDNFHLILKRAGTVFPNEAVSAIATRPEFKDLVGLVPCGHQALYELYGWVLRDLLPPRDVALAFRDAVTAARGQLDKVRNSDMRRMARAATTVLGDEAAPLTRIEWSAVLCGVRDAWYRNPQPGVLATAILKVPHQENRKLFIPSPRIWDRLAAEQRAGVVEHLLTPMLKDRALDLRVMARRRIELLHSGGGNGTGSLADLIKEATGTSNYRYRAMNELLDLDLSNEQAELLLAGNPSLWDRRRIVSKISGRLSKQLLWAEIMAKPEDMPDLLKATTLREADRLIAYSLGVSLGDDNISPIEWAVRHLLCRSARGFQRSPNALDQIVQEWVTAPHV
jgi:hypothetical protein